MVIFLTNKVTTYLLVGGVTDVALATSLRLEAPTLVGIDMVGAALIVVRRAVRRPLGVEVSVLGMARDERRF